MLVDQILRGRVTANMKVLDVGHGGGRNLLPLLALGCEVWGFDPNPSALAEAHLPPGCNLREGRLVQAALPDDPFPHERFDFVLLNAVLHFSLNAEEFQSWARAAWAKVKPGGLFMARLSTSDLWPKGSPSAFPFLASEGQLEALEKDWGAIRADPLKTVVVDGMRTMSTWILQAPIAP